MPDENRQMVKQTPRELLVQKLVLLKDERTLLKNDPSVRNDKRNFARVLKVISEDWYKIPFSQLKELDQAEFAAFVEMVRENAQKRRTSGLIGVGIFIVTAISSVVLGGLFFGVPGYILGLMGGTIGGGIVSINMDKSDANSEEFLRHDYLLKKSYGNDYLLKWDPRQTGKQTKEK